MSHSKRIDKANETATGALHRARQVAAQAKPLASSTRAAAGRGIHRTRAWAAPQVERTGKTLQDSVAPKISAMLSSAAHRLEPAKPKRRRWRKLAGISMLTAAAGAVAAVLRNRTKADLTPSAGTETDHAAPAAEMRDGKATPSTETEVDGQVSAR